MNASTQAWAGIKARTDGRDQAGPNVETIRLRHYVRCVHATDIYGVVTPLWVEWDDGRTFRIDRVLSRRGVARTRQAGSGTCYTVQIGRHITNVYRAGDGRWYVEVEAPADSADILQAS